MIKPFILLIALISYGSGPLPIRNQSPIYLRYLNPIPRSSEVLKKGSYKFDLNIGYSSIYTGGRSYEYETTMDMEILRTSINLNYGIRDKMELGIEIPFIYMYGGFLDSTIEDYHKAFGFPNGGREKAKKNQFRYSLIKGNRYIFNRNKEVSGIGDITLSTRFKLKKGYGIRFLLKTNTGSSDRLLGSGKIDYGFGLLFNREFKRLRFYINMDTIFLNNEKIGESKLKEMFGGLFSIEYLYKPKLSFILQLNGNRSPFPHTGLESFDRDVLQLTFGIKNPGLKRFGWYIGFTEDLISASSPDFSINFGLSFTHF
jgi:hypothetical protein